MAKYLVSVVETYRVDSENEAARLIEEAKNSSKYELAKYASEHKEVKQKGEVVDAFEKTTLTKVFNDIKEPFSSVEIHYHEPGVECPCESEMTF